MNLDLINQTIVDLEKEATTFQNCSKLADLYIVRKYYEGSKNDFIDKLITCYREYMCNKDEEDLICFLNELTRCLSIIEKENKNLIDLFYKKENIPSNLEIKK